MTVQKNTKCGFTIAELLIALAVMALLLTAVAVALNASSINYEENKDMFNALNMGRQAMMRMVNQLRTANSVAPTDPNTQCSFWTGDTPSLNRQFIYNSAKQELDLKYLDTNVSYPLCRNVTAMTFTRSVVTGTPSYVRSVQMSMTITVGNSRQTIKSAVVLRKTL